MVVASDVPSLKVLLDKFESRKKEKGNRRQQEKELQLSLDALYVELKKREATFIKSNQKARMKAMVECKEWEKKEIEKTGEPFRIVFACRKHAVDKVSLTRGFHIRPLTRFFSFQRII